MFSKKTSEGRLMKVLISISLRQALQHRDGGRSGRRLSFQLAALT